MIIPGDLMINTIKRFTPHAQKIKDAGGTLYIVGGAVRDFFLDRPVHDIDLCVTGLTVETFMGLFPEARKQGKSFPVFVVDNSEFAFARTEKKNGIGYTGFEINANPNISIEEDLYRRDLTINSMAVDVLTHLLVDPYKGMRDMVYSRIAPTSEHFKDDPVRALRAARFCAELNFHPTHTLQEYSLAIKEEIPTINNNLKFSEFQKAMSGMYPYKFIECLQDSGILDVAFPELHRLDGIPQANHTDGDVLQHTYAVLTKCSQLTTDPMVRTAALYHDVGKGTTPKDVIPHHYDHEKRSVEIIDALTWMPNNYKKYAKQVAHDHMRAHGYHTACRGTKVKMLLRQHYTCNGLKGFTAVAYADRPGLETLRLVAEMHEDLETILSISGKDMPENTPKGKEFGQRLHEARCKLLRKNRNGL